MLEKLTIRRSSIFTKLLLPMLLIAVAEMAVLFLILSFGGAFTTLRNSALDALDERTQNKQQPLQQELYTVWTGLDQAGNTLSRQLDAELSARGLSVKDMRSAPELNAELISAVAPAALSSFRQLDATGFMLILGGQGVSGQTDSYAGLYLRDTDPATDSADNRDVLLMRGFPGLSDQLGTPLAQAWQAAFTFSDPALSPDYFRVPYTSALNGARKEAQYYGLWSGPFRMSSDDPYLVLTYTIPLFSQSGEVLGVAGIEMNQSYLSSRFNTGEFARTIPGCYILGKMEDGRIRIAVTSGQMYRQHFRQDQTTLTIDSWLDRDSITLTGSLSGERMYATIQEMVLYPTASLHAGDEWYFLGLQSEELLLAPSYRFLKLMIIAGAVAVLLCVCVAILTSRGITRPISRMVGQVRSGSADLHLDPTGMFEIDELGDSILRLTRDVQESAERLSTTLRLTGLSVGVYEVKQHTDTAWCSADFFTLLDCPEDATHGGDVPKARLYQIMHEKLTDPIDTDVWRLPGPGGRDRYIRRVHLEHRQALLGAVMDVTSEIEDRLRIEHERDYDILTGLLNRRAFARITEDLFARQSSLLKIAAVVMMDLDNLKYVNDAYGHDCGDNYIRSFGEALAAFETHGPCILGRRSGDEFYALLYGYEDRETCTAALNQVWQQIMQLGIQLPDGRFYRFRCSGGVAWYPSDARDVPTLIHYADFAMYKVKQSAKGVLEHFDRSVYTEDAFLVNARDALNQLIDKQLLHYAFQPIVDARTGDIYGYELLMRPDVPELRTPSSTLRLAKAQGLLHHIERLSWYEGLRTVRTMQERGLLSPNTRIFLNSIANQVLDDEEEEHLLAEFRDLLPSVTLEVTESEENNMAYTARKLSFVRDHGGMVAIDDYGTGYNSEMALMLIDTDFVKVDISFIRNVDSDPDKQQLVRNLISYARRKNIMVLGEGVETRAELETLISFGMDYLQGYYLSHPSSNPPTITDKVRNEIIAAAKRCSGNPNP